MHQNQWANMPENPRVLIVDSSSESIEVLQTVLHRRGVTTAAARRAAVGLEMARRHGPQVIVVDADLLRGEDPRISIDFADEARRRDSQVVLLGKVASLSGVVEGKKTEIFAKPYHYSALIRKIEALLETRHAA